MAAPFVRTSIRGRVRRTPRRTGGCNSCSEGATDSPTSEPGIRAGL